MVDPGGISRPNVEEMVRNLAGAHPSCTLDILRGYCQCPLDEAAQERFTMATSGVQNATAFSQGIMIVILDRLFGRICMVWVDDVMIWAGTETDLLQRLRAVLERTLCGGLYAAAHKWNFQAGGAIV